MSSIDTFGMPAVTACKMPPSSPSSREDAILDAAFHAFSDYGYRRVSMEEIAVRAGLSRTALYLHFHNKEDLFRSLVQRHCQRCAEAFATELQKEGAPEDVLMAAFVAQDGKAVETMLGTPHGRELMDAGMAVADDIPLAFHAEIAGHLARWLEAQGADTSLDGAAPAAGMMLAALKGLKFSARTLSEYRTGQVMLARMTARALRK